MAEYAVFIDGPAYFAAQACRHAAGFLVLPGTFRVGEFEAVRFTPRLSTRVGGLGVLLLPRVPVLPRF